MNKFHVPKRYAMAIGKGHPVACYNRGVGRKAVDLRRSAGRQNHGFGQHGLENAILQIVDDHSLNLAIVFDQNDDKMLIQPFDLLKLGRCLIKGMQNMEAGLIGCKPGARDFHAAEPAHIDVSVRRSAPGTAPVLELIEFFCRL
ncbi:MAG: hypothetical protein IJM59_05070 [Proteobacteria bacterium]|nr:hypothetical protein [Pseudomonadota bacterium]